MLNREHSVQNQRICILTKPTKQHSKVTLRIYYSSPPPTPARPPALLWKPLWYYVKIHFAIPKFI